MVNSRAIINAASPIEHKTSSILIDSSSILNESSSILNESSSILNESSSILNKLCSTEHKTISIKHQLCSLGVVVLLVFGVLSGSLLAQPTVIFDGGGGTLTLSMVSETLWQSGTGDRVFPESFEPEFHAKIVNTIIIDYAAFDFCLGLLTVEFPKELQVIHP